MNDLNILENAQDCGEECLLPDGDVLKITKKRSVLMRVITNNQL